MLLPGSRLDGAVNAVADANFRISFKRYIGRRVILPDCREQTKHSLLNEILTVATGEKQRPRADTHQAAVALGKRFLGGRVPGAHLRQQLCIGQLEIIHHSLSSSNTIQNKL